ncbi:netrin-3-like isoform X1 [Clavelina lepadiformis]|uniref:netrin-3-like isoform X1 n=1 Tax=Clavelina lepadiformis TaxID=159417 RepID=UPI0040434131
MTQTSVAHHCVCSQQSSNKLYKLFSNFQIRMTAYFPGSVRLQKRFIICFILLLHSTLTLQKRNRAYDPCYDSDGNPQQCIPEFENIAIRKKVVVSETCGVPKNERYCRPVVNDGHIRRECDVCERTGDRSHPASYLTDINDNGNVTYWQSRIFHSQQNGAKKRNVTLTISFGKQYELSYVYLEFFSPRPKSMIIYKSMDKGHTWVPYQYYARDCRETFSLASKNSTNRTNEVICWEGSSIPRPLNGGKVVFNPTGGRPSEGNIESSFILQDWITASDIKIVLTDLYDIRSEFGAAQRRGTRNDRSVIAGTATSNRRRVPKQISRSGGMHGSTSRVPRRRGRRPKSSISRSLTSLPNSFYAINDISIGGRCKCNGHASRCHLKNGKMQCDCKHNTDGVNCESCKAFHYDRPWKRATSENANACVACDCNLHAKKCRFNPDLFMKSGGKSGGVCQKCRHHTTGRSCNYCKPGYYRNPKVKSVAHRKMCKPCRCHLVGSAGKICHRRTGQCPCKENVTGKKCNRCVKGFVQTQSRVVPCISYPPSRPTPTQACKVCRPQSANLSLSKLCKVDYVVEMKVISHTLIGKWVRVTIEIVRTFKRGDVRLHGPIDIRMRQRHFSCTCPRLRKNRKYLLLGKYDRSTRTPSLTIDKNSVLLRWKRKYRSQITKLLRRSRAHC